MDNFQYFNMERKLDTIIVLLERINDNLEEAEISTDTSDEEDQQQQEDQIRIPKPPTLQQTEPTHGEYQI